MMPCCAAQIHMLDAYMIEGRVDKQADISVRGCRGYKVSSTQNKTSGTR